MKLPDSFRTTYERLKTEALRVSGALRAQTGGSQALTQFWRPNLGPTPLPLERFLEPAVAAVALMALASLLTIGVVSLTVLVLVLGAVYAILTYVFGLELELSA